MAIEVIFYVFAAIAIIGAFLVITSGNPVRAVLSKVLTFIAGAGVWMTMQAEYLSLLLIVVYVGAVLIMFLFVVMMLDVDVEVKRASFVRYWWIALPVVVVLAALLIWVVGYHNFGVDPRFASLAVALESQNDIKTLGVSMFTDYLYPFELSALVLLAAMVAAITLVFRGRRKDNKAISASKQIAVKSSDRLKMIKMEVVKPTKEGDNTND
jgi:NADH-quinone oxidoreductase subunit J